MHPFYNILFNFRCYIFLLDKLVDILSILGIEAGKGGNLGPKVGIRHIRDMLVQGMHVDIVNAAVFVVPFIDGLDVEMGMGQL